jgi:hypothetical protein
LLAAVLGRFNGRVRKVGAAASLLILALITSGCAPLLAPYAGSRLFAALSEILKLLPEEQPNTPLELFMEVAGGDYGQKYADILTGWTDLPSLDVGLWSDLEKIVFVFSYAAMFFFFLKYLWRVGEYADDPKYGMKAVNAGAAAIVPPLQYIVRRFLPVAVLIVPMVKLVPVVMELLSDTIRGAALALYASAETDMAAVVENIFELMLEDMQIWVFLLTFVINAVVLLIFMAVLSWRFMAIPIYTFLIYLQAPKFLNGEEPGELAKPLERAMHRIFVLVATWFILLIGPLIVLNLGTNGLPAAIAVTIGFVLAIGFPWLLFGFSVFGKSVYSGLPVSRGFAGRLVAPVYRITRTPGAVASAGEQDSFWQRTWNRVPNSLKVMGGIGLEVAKREPHAGPLIATGEVLVSRMKETQKHPEVAARPIAHELFTGQRFDVSAGEVVGPDAWKSRIRSRAPAMDKLVSAAIESKLSELKGRLTDDHYGFAAGMVASGYGVSTIDQLVNDAAAQLANVKGAKRNTWSQIGNQLKGDT